MYLVALSPFIDSVNGFFMLNGYDISISSIYKNVIMALCLFRMRYMQKKRAMQLFGFIWLIGFSSIVATLMDSGGFWDNISMSVKMLMPMVFLAYLMEKRKSNDAHYCLTKVIECITWFYPLSILVPTLLGTGFNTYASNEFGYKGFYYAGNELGAIMIVLFALSMQRYTDNKRKIDLVCLVLNFTIDVFIGVKSIYIALTIFFIIYLYKNIGGKKIGAFLGAGLILFGTGILIVRSGNDFLNEMIELQRWRFEIYASKYESNTWINFLLSGRNAKIEDSLSVLIQSYGIMGVLFGRGIHYMVSTIGSIVEMDFVDLFLWYGIVVSFALAGKFFAFFSKNWRKFFTYEKVMILEIFGFAALAGHVLFAPAVGMVFSLAVAKALYRYDSKRINNKG